VSRHAPSALVISGWTLFAHPLFLDQVEALIQQVDALKQRDPDGFTTTPAAKRLAAIYRLAFAVIPQDPLGPQYRQGNTLGEDHRHWFRAKFYQRYRLFFRCHASSRIIVYAWVNDAASLSEARDERNRLQRIIEHRDTPDA
jgi:toxin YhaV